MAAPQSAEKTLEDMSFASSGRGFRKFLTTPDDGANLDAYQRQRVSGIETIFETKPEWDDDPLFWETVTTGGGAANFAFDQDAILMSLSSTGDRVVRQSHGYIPYQPGKSQLIIMSGQLAVQTNDVASRLGYYDDNDGVFCETRESGVGWTLRSSVSGSPVDDFVPQERWNLDKMNGRGPSADNPSGINLDATKAQVFVIDLQWLGVGRVRCGFQIDGGIHYVHEYRNANRGDTVYMQTASLPVRYELVATGPNPSLVEMKQICASVSTEGGDLRLRGIEFAAGNGGTLRSITMGNRLPVCSIRNAMAFKGNVNRIPIDPDSFLTVTQNKSIFWEVLINPTTLTGPSFNPADVNSSMEFDVVATGVAGGTRIRSGYLTTAGPGASGSGSDGPRLLGDLRMALDMLALNPDVLTLAATAIGGTADVGAMANWREHQ